MYNLIFRANINRCVLIGKGNPSSEIGNDEKWIATKIPHVLGREKNKLPFLLFFSDLQHHFHANPPVYHVLKIKRQEVFRNRYPLDLETYFDFEYFFFYKEPDGNKTCFRDLRTMNTSNSSRHLKGDSIASQRAMMNDTVEKDLSPPDKERVSLAIRLEPCSTLT